ncbi:hypothetical protein [Dyadobacter frigoris]|uniref:Uncharacterized protein n=1 Tax=Dyadobacter frigoris TaxID=2576211 RepID=A0A4U6D3J9_9BACT|nr:hypothetical protein [Dyadobacter frigoris]TKT90767.1 hypothetical protein FDK13_17520 [Dyadobacter frigoris]GLU52102.1 hypothetical protein Dfri01_15630 [Dyadobacter frigoris]
MSKPSILTKLTFSLLLLTAATNLQAQTLTDPGMSQHNYKMPNKAAQAKIKETGEHFAVTMNTAFDTELHQAPKYAVRPSSIVIALHEKKEPMSLNPLSSVSNYKTQPVPKMQSTPEEYSASLN